MRKVTMLPLLALVLAMTDGMIGTVSSSDSKGKQESPRLLKYERTSIVTPLHESTVTGSATPVDWDNDGDVDLVIAGRLYKNVGGDIFRRADEISQIKSSRISIADMNGDGLWDIVSGSSNKAEVHVYLNTGTHGKPLFPLVANLVVPQKLIEAARPAGRRNPFTFSSPASEKPGGEWLKGGLTYISPHVADWNGDGLPDIIIGGDDVLTDYFFYRPWHDRARGNVNFGHYYGEIYWLPNKGAKAKPYFPMVEPLRLHAEPLTVNGICSPTTVDWDGDGDLDLLLAQTSMPALYFENVGSSTKPELAQPQYLDLENPGTTSQISTPDWDGDGLFDLLVASEDGVFLYRNSGEAKEPRFASPFQTIQQIANEVWVPGFATPDVVDYDGDGNLDLVVGSDDGDFRLFRNIGSRTHPMLADPELLKAKDGQALRIVVDLAYQPQGPVERFWGYSNPVLVDWDGDGDPDILSGQVARTGYLWFENSGNRRQPAWERPRLIEPAGKALRTSWDARIKPAPVDWNKDGLMDLVLVNERFEYVLCLRKRSLDGNVSLEAPELLRFQTGKPLMVSGIHPRAGIVIGEREQPNVYDWDGDGDWDLIVGGFLDQGHEFTYLENIGSNEKPLFAEPKQFTNDVGIPLKKLARQLVNNAFHTFSIDVADWNGDGVPDLLAGVDQGYVLFFDGTTLRPTPRIKTRLR